MSGPMLAAGALYGWAASAHARQGRALPGALGLALHQMPRERHGEQQPGGELRGTGGGDELRDALVVGAGAAGYRETMVAGPRLRLGVGRRVAPLTE